MNGIIVILAIAYLADKMLEAIIDRYAIRKNENAKVSSMQIEL